MREHAFGVKEKFAVVLILAGFVLTAVLPLMLMVTTVGATHRDWSTSWMFFTPILGAPSLIIGILILARMLKATDSEDPGTEDPGTEDAGGGPPGR